jgi:hypothetical protein
MVAPSWSTQSSIPFHSIPSHSIPLHSPTLYQHPPSGLSTPTTCLLVGSEDTYPRITERIYSGSTVTLRINVNVKKKLMKHWWVTNIHLRHSGILFILPLLRLSVCVTLSYSLTFIKQATFLLHIHIKVEKNERQHETIICHTSWYWVWWWWWWSL